MITIHCDRTSCYYWRSKIFVPHGDWTKVKKYGECYRDLVQIDNMGVCRGFVEGKKK